MHVPGHFCHDHKESGMFFPAEITGNNHCIPARNRMPAPRETESQAKEFFVLVTLKINKILHPQPEKRSCQSVLYSDGKHAGYRIKTAQSPVEPHTNSCQVANHFFRKSSSHSWTDPTCWRINKGKYFCIKSENYFSVCTSGISNQWMELRITNVISNPGPLPSADVFNEFSFLNFPTNCFKYLKIAINYL